MKTQEEIDKEQEDKKEKNISKSFLKFNKMIELLKI